MQNDTEEAKVVEGNSFFYCTMVVLAIMIIIMVMMIGD